MLILLPKAASGVTLPKAGVFREKNINFFKFPFYVSYKVNQMEGEHILITGGLGFVGSNLAIRCVELGAKVTLFTHSMKKLANIKEIKNNVEIVQGDITSYDDVKNTIKNKNKIFHLAAQTSGITSMENPYLDINTNLLGTMNLLENCRKYNDSTKLIFTGTITEAGIVNNFPLTGEEKDEPISIYDVDKLICEKYAYIYYNSYNLNTTCLRLATLFGERQQLNSPRFGIINYFIGRLIKKEPILVYDKGNFIRDYNYVANIIDALLLAAQNDKTNGEVFLIGSNRKIKFIDMVKEVITAVEEVMHIKGQYKLVPFPKEHKKVDVGNSLVSYRKFHETTGWKPKISFEEGIRNTVAFYKDRYKDYL